MDQTFSLSDRERIKGEIVALFREADAAASAYAELRDSVKALAARWKYADNSTGAVAPGSKAAHASATQRVDHLGASTFIEKGWSLLSMGDAVAAEQAFVRAIELAPASNEAESLLGWAQMMQENYDSALLTFHNVLLREPQNAMVRTNVGYICLRKKIYGEAIEHLSRAIRLGDDKKAALYAHLYLGQVYYEREMYDDADCFFRKAIELGPNLLQAWYELGRSQWYAGNREAAIESWRSGCGGEQVQSMGKTVRRVVGESRTGWRAAALIAAVVASVLVAAMSALFQAAVAQTPAAVNAGASATAQSQKTDMFAATGTATRPRVSGENFRIDSGRFTVVANRTDSRLAHAVLAAALMRDTFPGLPKPRAHVLIAIAPTAVLFRAWVGPNAPEWGAAVAIPDEQRIVLQGAFAGSDAGDPLVVLRHELAHLALHEALGDLPPRWFDEGYASVSAGEWSRTTALETSVSLMWRSMPGGEELNAGFYAGSSRAQYTYALSHLAVAEMQAIDERRGLANFFAEWKRTGKYDLALRQAYGMTASSFDNYWHRRTRR